MDVFSQFRRNRNISPQATAKAEDIYFLLQHDDSHLAYIIVVNKQQKEITSFDYSLYEGVQRSLLKTISLLQSNAGYTIDWNNPGSHIYLHELRIYCRSSWQANGLLMLSLAVSVKPL